VALAWPTVFDTPQAVDRAWVDYAASHPANERTALRQALAFARARHAAQWRRGSETPFWVHLVRVALELARWGQDTPVLIQAALLHDVVEDTPTTVAEVREGFGSEVATLVDWLTAPPSREGAACTAYYARLAGSGPPESHVLKLADRTDNLRSIQALVMRTGNRHRRWAGRYLERTQVQVVPLTGDAPSIARVTLFTAMADLAPLVEDGLTES
jgi:guanosine-3',5'-bis(diphosphate) 3'-pyrophosphohydrolase